MFSATQKFRSLICADVPIEYNNEQDLLKHFSQFGQVQAVVPAPQKGRAKVVFEMSHEAELAKQNGADIDGASMQLFYADDNRVSRVKKSKRENSSQAQKVINITRTVTGLDRYPRSIADPRMRKMRSSDNGSHLDHPDLDPRKRAMNRRTQSVYRPKSFNRQVSAEFESQQGSASGDFGVNVAHDEGQEPTKISSVFGRRAGEKLLKRARTYHRGKFSSVFNKDNRQLKSSIPDANAETESKSVFGKLVSAAPSVFDKSSAKLDDVPSGVFGTFSPLSQANIPNTEKSSTSAFASGGFGSNMKRFLNEDTDVTNSSADSTPYKKFAGPSKESELQTRITSVPVENLQLLTKIDKLKARDENIRKILNWNQVKGGILVGTLDLMCPELEIYVRQSTNRVDEFELNSAGEADATKFVKEYTRSSADKENPLPHEVRSIKGLKLSMDYLMDTVINSYDSDKSNSNFSPGNWFNFLWNRTRSIRNDITIQNMHTIEAVELIEKITRFHIFCGYALSDCEYHEFDPKVNTEHYRKSMQTLKHIYYDLSSKGIQCPNEAEFRSYELLKNLDNPAGSLVEAARYSPRVLNDGKFQLALKMHRAFTQENFVRFLRLYKTDASFLMSCISHKFLIEARVSVLKCLSTSCGAAKNTYTVEEIQELLSFDFSEQVLKFCEPFGFVDDSNTTIIEVRKLTPEEEMQVAEIVNLKDANLIDSKQGKNLGEIINGDQPIDISYKQQLNVVSNLEDSQFSDIETSQQNVNIDRNLIEHDDNSRDSNFEETYGQDFQDGDYKNSDFAHDSKLREQEFFSDFAELLYEDLVIEIAEDQSRQAILELIEKARRLKETVALICFEMETEVLHELANFTAKEVINESRASVIANSAYIYEDILGQVAVEMCTKVAKEAILCEKEQQIASFMSKMVFTELNEELVSELCAEIAEETCKESKDQAVNLKIKRSYFNNWKEKIARAKEHKFYRESFPPKIGVKKIDPEQFSPKYFQTREKLTYISKLNDAQQCLKEIAANEICEPFTTFELLGNLVSKYVHVVILNVSPKCEFSQWFLSKFSGLKSDLVKDNESVVRCEKSALLSYLYVSCIEIDNVQNYLEKYRPNLFIILDANKYLEESWVNETCVNNKELFISCYVSACENNLNSIEENANVVKFCFDSSNMSKFQQSTEKFLKMIRLQIEDCSKMHEMPHKVSLQNFIVPCLREWFSLFMTCNYITGLQESFQRAMTVEWLLELYDSLVNQLEKFITGNRTDFPLPIFATQVKELDINCCSEIFKKLRIFPGNILSAVGNCNSWIECLDILEKLIGGLYPEELCQILGRKFEAILVSEYGDKTESETLIMASNQTFPWILLFIELIMFNSELVWSSIDDSFNVFLSRAESEFVFERPDCWNLYLKAVLNSTKVTSYNVNGTVVLVK